MARNAEDRNVTSKLTVKSAMLASCMVIGISVAAHAQGTQMPDQQSKNGWFRTAQTNGMHRRDDRRGTRQDCRQAEGAAGADKRHCKQQGRQTRSS